MIEIENLDTLGHQVARQTPVSWGAVTDPHDCFGLHGSFHAQRNIEGTPELLLRTQHSNVTALRDCATPSMPSWQPMLAIEKNCELRFLPRLLSPHRQHAAVVLHNE